MERWERGDMLAMARRKGQATNPNTPILADTETMFHRIRRYSGNPNESYIILAWDVRVLRSILEHNYRTVIPNPRASYIVLFMKPKPRSCQNRAYKERFQEVTKYLWQVFGVLNVLILAPCYCTPRMVYMYEPFVGTDNDTSSMGRCEEITLVEIVADPENIMNVLTDLAGYRMRVSIFERAPTAVRNLTAIVVNENSLYKDLSRSKGFGGVDGLVLQNLAQVLNFTVEIVGPVSGEDYGRIMKDGTLTGSLRDVVTGLADFSANSRFMSDIEHGVEYTRPISTDRLCLIVPKSLQVPQWLMIFNCFKAQTWISIMCLNLLCTIFWVLIHMVSLNGQIFSTNRPKNWSIVRIFVVSQMIKLPTANYSRIFLASALAFNVIVTGIFQGSLVTSFSTVSYYDEINTLEQLDRSNLKILSTLNIFENDTTSETRMRLNKKTSLSKGWTMNRAARKRDVAAIERKRDAFFMIHTQYLKDDGIPYLHIVQECPSSSFLAYIVPVGSPFLQRFDSILIRFMEGGFIDKWYDDLVQTLVLHKKASLHDDSTNKGFSFADIQTAFYFLGFGVLFASIVLIVEVFMFKKKSRNKLYGNVNPLKKLTD